MPSSPDLRIASWLAGKTRGARIAAPAADRWLGRPFSRRAQVRVAIHWLKARISYSQVHPFLRHAEALRVRHGAEIRLFDVASFIAQDRPLPEADVILVQPWFDTPPARLAAALERQRVRSPDAGIAFLDSFAHNDLRLGAAVDPYVSHYLKKTLYRDREAYFGPTQGDTGLSDYYGRLYDLDQAEVCWNPPRRLLSKLRLSPNFFTSPGLMQGFMGDPPDFAAARPIDLHARLTARGDGWYGRMRQDWMARTAAMTDLEIASGTGIGHAEFMAELGRSKLALSPFGYGEPCWRDIEGILAGAVVVKQDMGHLESLPNLFRPWETYAPVAWDLSDLEDVVRRLLADPGLRERIARTAWQEVRTYLETERFVDDMGFLFED